MTEKAGATEKEFIGLVEAFAHILSMPGQSHYEATVNHLMASIMSLRMLSDLTEQECEKDIIERVQRNFATFNKDHCAYVLREAANFANAQFLQAFNPRNIQ